MKAIFFFLFVAVTLTSYSRKCSNPAYSVANSSWTESLGNHRAVLEISVAAEVVTLNLTWRRHDLRPEAKRFLIISATTGDTIPNIFRSEVNKEQCRIAFGPVNKPGKYYFYYLPFEVQQEYGNYNKDYFKPEKAPAIGWMQRNRVDRNLKLSNFPAAIVNRLESRTAFDSFYPMEVTPLASEKKALIANSTKTFMIFPEDRRFPIRMKDEIPLRWVEKGTSAKFAGEAAKNEYYTFQIGVFASKEDLKNVKVEFQPLVGESMQIPVSALTCFNTGGVGPYGVPFEKILDIAKGFVQPL